MTTSFDSPDAVRSALSTQKYIVSDEISTIVFLAQKLDKPLLAEGPAGMGRTELAKAISGATGCELIHLQCYEGLDESKALYEWEYSKDDLWLRPNLSARILHFYRFNIRYLMRWGWSARLPRRWRRFAS